MVEAINILIYCIVFLGGYILALSLLTRKYQVKARDLFDFMLWNKKIEKDEYDYYIEKYIKKQDGLKNVTETIKGLRKKREIKNE